MSVKVVARRKLTVGGKKLEAGDEVDASTLPPGRLKQLLDIGWAYETGDMPTMSVSPESAPGKGGSGNSLQCDTCEKTFKSPQGVRLHQYRVHGSRRP